MDWRRADATANVVFGAAAEGVMSAAGDVTSAAGGVMSAADGVIGALLCGGVRG